MQTNFFDGASLIAAERKEQLTKHKRTVESDVKHNSDKQLLRGAMAIAYNEHYMCPPHWSYAYFQKVSAKSYEERLIIAGALIAAEIDRVKAAKNGN